MGTQEVKSAKLAPYIGKRDREALRYLRLQRWRARAWMRQKGIRDLGRVVP